MALAQEKPRGGIGETQALGRKLKSIALALAPTLPGQLIHFPGPTVAQIVAGDLSELVERPTGVHAQTEGGSFAGSRQRGQLFPRFNGSLAGFDPVTV